MPVKSGRLSRWMGTGIFFFLGSSALLAVILHVGFGLPLAKLVGPITLLVVIQLGFCAAIYWFRKRFDQTHDPRIGIAIFGLFALVLGLIGMYYAGNLGLSTRSLFRDNYLGFSVFTLVVISICVILFSYRRGNNSRS